MKHIVMLVLLACSALLASCSLTTRLDRIGCGAPRDIPTSKLLLFGGQAGSVEDPAFVGKVACFSASQAPTALGLELPVGEQDAINRYLHSGGGAPARAKLLSGAFWQTDRDGRSSASMFKLIDYARRMQQEGMPLTVFAFSEDKPSLSYALYVREPVGLWPMQPFGASPSATYDAFMAREIHDFQASHPNLQIVALMGDVHAGQLPVYLGRGRSVASTGDLLRDLSPTAILLLHHAGYPPHFLGKAWFCSEEFCGIHKVSNIYRWVDARRPNFYHDSMFDGYSTTYVLPSLTESPPAVDVSRR